MSARIAKLEQLLTRVQERADQPRPALAAAAAPEEEAVDEELEAVDDEAPAMDELDEIDDLPEIDEVEIDESDLPESGRVMAATPSMDDAIDDAAHQPPVTPPPESGEELTSPHILDRTGPTMEQLGQTIPLEEGGAQDFELDEPTLDEPSLSEPPPSHGQELPASVPAPQADLAVPENAREELERVRLGESTPFEARVSTRPVLSTTVIDLVSSAREFAPKSFLDLLEASLKLK